MKESKLIVNIQNLSPKDRQAFRQFVISPYFNQHTKTIELLDYIYNFVDKRPEKLDRKIVFQKLFPKEGYDEQTLFNLMSNLKTLS
ncbi:MAG: hypothetical protein R2795_05865 [Saprospiraceae bacterium]